jgi:hypothetical protein
MALQVENELLPQLAKPAVDGVPLSEIDLLSPHG